MLTSINIGKRMGLAFATLVCLSLALAATGYWGLSTVSEAAHRILEVDVVAADTSGQVQASTLNLREGLLLEPRRSEEARRVHGLVEERAANAARVARQAGSLDRRRRP